MREKTPSGVKVNNYIDYKLQYICLTPMPRGALHHGQGALYTMVNPRAGAGQADSAQFNLKTLRCQWPSPAAGGRGIPQPAWQQLGNTAGARLSAGALGRRAARLNGGKFESPVEAASDSPSELPAGLGASVTVTQLSLPAAQPGRAGPASLAVTVL